MSDILELFYLQKFGMNMGANFIWLPDFRFALLGGMA